MLCGRHSQGIEAGNDKALGFEKPFDIDAVMSGVFESYFCIFHRLTVKSIQDRFKKSVKTSPVIWNPEIVRIDCTIRINDEAIMFGFGNVDTDIEHRKPPLMMGK